MNSPDTCTTSPHSANPPGSDSRDRYVSFCGIDCDGNANRLISMLENHLANDHGDMRWKTYFEQKRAQQAAMNQDNLYFIGAQMNSLYSYLESCEDEEVLSLLWQLEQECC
ncbi:MULTISPECIES: N(2)-fixation sustaining protein CowN [unclassified Oceanobacter]|uniref:N(2)-fixation sustaining protein CowN n=1 Tax=unclassified Oceanobacter TaxID=2620260 RepID=UPI0026E36BAF|nr:MULTISPECIES: N(2)-fixation sustaining protein CowN [unclassified Oceanobacter]MDO6681732.1 N(2)-fixation sustaining protein CowN [Oceanobacter sp. 5_MG-2023]MDP2549417.1 N(2)-fixation sustaining protein CowN [Oceanobacter sp. 4_MG-2023]MDP2610148.1 N(2)-fixation sustaining protein CowN [Oceanobacter sp. 1_MG-2023]MDP2613443.1 N(2)-fixation sustaining protein CowN [Oceanobacter sp. 2_MG-2023]